ncbi:helix-turn-helix transcriptional regulator [Actinoplanes sp. CA-252034]|uniref:helix-turn-helix transcriptional regulator n=1 Tax=Actinoplanes sp. CA-252034 TaxID=3239906 RepID=UPI003D969AE4
MRVHSLPVEPQPAPCTTVAAAPVGADLRRHVLGYGGFRSGDGVALRHRVLPAVAAVLVIDVDSGDAFVTGPRTRAVLAAERWGHGVTAGLTPAGVATVLGMPMGELAGAIVPFEAPDLVERVAAAEAWADRFAVLDGWMRRTARDADHRADPGLVAAWRRLQRSGPPGVDEVAALLGVRRRRLEQAFQRYVGVAPGAVACVARFQRAVGMLAGHTALGRVAAECGYADQPHLTREVGAMSGCTPGELRRHLHAAQSFKTSPVMLS